MGVAPRGAKKNTRASSPLAGSERTSAREPLDPASVRIKVPERRTSRPSTGSPSVVGVTVCGAGTLAVPVIATADASAGRSSRLAYGAARTPATVTTLPRVKGLRSMPDGKWTQMPPEPSWMAMTASPRIRPGSTVTVPDTETAEPIGRARAAAINSMGPLGTGVGVGLAVGVGRGVGEGL